MYEHPGLAKERQHACASVVLARSPLIRYCERLDYPDQRPLNTGIRFSLKARIASLVSSVEASS